MPKTTTPVTTSSDVVYKNITRVHQAVTTLFWVTALIFISIHPKGDFPGWMSATVVGLGVVAVVLTSIRWGMCLENPARN